MGRQARPQEVRITGQGYVISNTFQIPCKDASGAVFYATMPRSRVRGWLLNAARALADSDETIVDEVTDRTGEVDPADDPAHWGD